MDKAQVKHIVVALQKLVEIEVKKQMVLVKKQVMQEIRATQSLQGTVKPQQPKRQLTANPYLNEILANTDPNTFGDDPMPTVKAGPIPMPSTDFDGKAINYTSPAVQSVMESMMKKYDVSSFTAPTPKATSTSKVADQAAYDPYNDTEW